MNGDPYSRILKIMSSLSNENSLPGIEIATVIQSPPTLLIRYRELEIDNDDIFIADYLLGGYNRQVEINGAQAEIKTRCTLKKGDLVALIPTSDKQRFIVLAKLAEVS